jgi:DNA-binding protein H-NS
MKTTSDNGTKDSGWKMKPDNLNSMSADQLWSLHEQVTLILASKLAREKTELEGKLRKLRVASSERRPYPPVLPKYRNSARPYETLAGRGKRPRWLSEQLRRGRKLDDFRIQAS